MTPTDQLKTRLDYARVKWEPVDGRPYETVIFLNGRSVLVSERNGKLDVNGVTPEEVFALARLFDLPE